MRFGVVSDIHGNLPALLAVVADAGKVDVWLNLGDILSGPLWPAETADWLMSRAWPTIAGNHERQLLGRPPDGALAAAGLPAPTRMSATDAHTAARLAPAHFAWLAGLPAAMAPAPGLRCVHGTPASDLAYLLETVTPAGLREASDDEVAARLAPVDGGLPGCSLLLCGHSHLPRDRPVGGVRIVNPGSVGLPAYDDEHPFEHRVENGSPHARYAVIAGGDAGWTVDLRAVAYDWEAAARRAESHARGDWADALRSGRVGRLEREMLSR